MCPSGMITTQLSPARAAYAAAEAEVFPVDAQTTALAPSARALEIAIVIPRSLNDPVGLAPSSFSQTWAPTRSDNLGAGISGVPPSKRVTTGSPVWIGRKGRYSSTTPRHAILRAVMGVRAPAPHWDPGRPTTR